MRNTYYNGKTMRQWSAVVVMMILLCGIFAPLTFVLAGDATQTDPGFITQPASTPQGNSAAKGSTDSSWGAKVGNVVLSVGALFTYYGGMLLESSLRETVFEMGKDVNSQYTTSGSYTQGLGASINTTWSVIRDICNLIFIFGFIYIGIRTIIDADSSSTKRFLAQIIIGALLINFSLFIAKFVIDVSNFTAFKLYEGLVQGGGFISENFAQLMGISGLYKTNAETLVKLTGGGAFWFYFMGAIMLIIAAFVMAAGGILLIIRYVALILIMIFSPVLFAATVFPQTAGYAKTLWSKLFSYAFFAPVYLLLLIVSIEVLRGISVALGVSNGSGSVRAFSEGLTQTGSAFTVILNFVIVIMFLIFTLLVAKQMGVKGGEMAVSVGQDIRKRGQKMLTNTALWGPRVAARAGVGWSSKRMLKSFDKWQAKEKGTFGTGVQKTMEYLNLDRSVRGGLTAGTKIKAGLKYSYKENEDYKKERSKVTTQLQPVTKLESALKIEDAQARSAAIEKIVRDMSKAQLEKAGFDIVNNPDVMRHITSNMMDDLSKSEEFSEGQKEKMAETRKKIITDIFVKNGRTITSELVNASISQLETLGHDFLTENAYALTDSQMKDLEKSKKFTESEFQTIKTAREEKMNAWITTPVGTRQIFQNFTGNPTQFYKDKKSTEVALLPRNILMNPNSLPYLSAGVLEQIADKKSLNPEDRRILARRITAPDSGAQSGAIAYIRSSQGQRMFVGERG